MPSQTWVNLIIQIQHWFVSFCAGCRGELDSWRTYFKHSRHRSVRFEFYRYYVASNLIFDPMIRGFSVATMPADTKTPPGILNMIVVVYRGVLVKAYAILIVAAVCK
jgi:hypothetical protein